MNDLERVMWKAWGRVGPMLRADRDELKARLARRRSKMYLRPMRAWCLAVRASDHRITAWNAPLVPEDAMDLRCEAHPGRVVEHEVTLDARLLRELCRPVRIESPGQPWWEVAKMLGTDQHGLRPLRRNGTLAVDYVKGLDGRAGKPTPMLYSRELLDPAAFGKCRPDPIWGCLWEMQADFLPDGFAHELVRTPVYREGRHGEELRGWRWICPGCRKGVKTVYYPLPLPDWGQYVGLAELIGGIDQVDDVPEPAACFACGNCHGVIRFSRGALQMCWNQLVLHFSGGLLYGQEVERPVWLKAERKRAFRRRRNSAPRLERLAELLRTELPVREIAREMGLSYQSVSSTVGHVYRRYGVHSRGELKGLAFDA